MISKFSVKRPYTVVVGVVLVLILGIVSFTSMKTDLLPDMTLPYALVMTTYPGASPEEVETVVTRPVEQAMATISNIENVTSVSSENMSTVILEFAQSANMDAVTIEMRESLDQIKGYWDDTIGSPIIMKLNPDMMPVMVAALEAGDMTSAELTDFVEGKILPELESIEGVASVTPSGNVEEQIRVVIRQEKIDEVNRQITESLDRKFADAEEEMSEARKGLEEGKEQLEEGENALVSGTSSAQGQISTGQAELIKNEVQIDSSLQTIAEKLQELETSERLLTSQESVLDEGQKQLDALTGQLEELNAQEAQLNAAIEMLDQAPDQLSALRQARDAAQSALDALGAGSQPQPPETGSPETETGAPETGSPDAGTGALETGSTDAGAATEATLQSDSTEAQPQPSSIEVPPQPDSTEAAPEIQQPLTEGTSEAQTSSAAGMSMKSGYSGSQSVFVNASAQGADAPGGFSAASAAAMTESPAEESTEGNTEGNTEKSTEGTQQMPAVPEMPDINPGQTADIAQLQAQIAQADAGIAAIQAGLLEFGIDESQIADKKAELEAARTELTKGKEKLAEAVEKIPEQQAEIDKGREQIAAGKAQLEAGRQQLNTAKAQLEGAKSQIASGKSTVSQAVAELNKQQVSASIQMATTKVKLETGEKELDAAEEQLKSQKETAYDSADLTDIVTADMVKGILAAQNFSMPAGYVTEEGIDYLVRVGDKLADAEELKKLELLDMHMDGVNPVRLEDVADVTVTDNSGEVYAKINGNAGILFTMQKQSGYSTGDVSKRIKTRFQEIMEEQDNTHIITLMDQGVYIDMVVSSVLQNMLFGAALAVIVLLLFLKSIRPTIVIAFSIPISIMTALVLMYFSGISLNIISLSGLALGIGMLVDNSIVVIENIFRLRNQGMSARKAAVEGARQVSGAIAASTLTTICVFAPIIFTEGITRQLFVDMGLTIAYSLLASLLIALTLVPMMGAGLLKKTAEKKSRFFEKLQNGCGHLITLALRFKAIVLLAAVALLVVSGVLAVSRGTAFMPEMESTQVSVGIELGKEATLEDTGKMADQVMERILTIEDVTDIGVMAGGSGGSMMGGSSSDNEATMYVLLKEDKKLTNDEITEAILEKTEDLACTVNVQTSNMDMSALGGSGISVKIKGRELDKLQEIAADVAAIVGNTEGVANVSDGVEEKEMELRLKVDKDKAMKYQLTTAQVYQFLQGKLADARSATTLAADAKDYSVMVVNGTDKELTREDIKKLTITGKDAGGKEKDVPLSEIVTFEDKEGLTSIRREAQTRYLTVTGEIDKDHNIGLVSAEIEKELKNYDIPKGYSVEMAGEDETINEAMGEVFKMLGLAVVFMYLIMVAQFQSLLSPFIIMFTIPLAFTGGLFGLYITGSPVSVIAMIGFVMLSGIIVNNGIVLVDYTNQLRREGMEKRAALAEAGRTRLRPIIMTAMTTVLGLSTMAAGMGMGADMMQPMAIVTIGGLIYGTLLTLFVVPCIYDIFNRKKDMTEEEI